MTTDTLTTDTLTERYVHAAVRTVPPGQRSEVGPEVRELVLDTIAAKEAGGLGPAEAERAALVELGDPEVLAAAYSDRPLQLIGPRYYLEWWRLLKTLLAVVVPIVAVVIAVLTVLEDDGAWGEAIGAAVWGAVTTGVHIAFWVTLTFALLDRFGAGHGIEQGVGGRPLTRWTPSDLPAVPVPGAPGRGETVTAVLGAVSVIGVAVWQQVDSPVTVGGRSVPVFEPGLWSFWLPFLLVVFSLEAVVAVAAYRRRGWSWSLVGVHAALQVAFAVPVVWLLSTGDLLNQEFFDRLGWPEGAQGGSVMAVAVSLSVIGVTLWDVADKAWRTRRSGRRAAASQAAPTVAA